MSTLPSTRSLLTTLLNTLTTSAPQTNSPRSAPSNPLKNLPPSQRALLTTLHVLFPPPMLLQALDLLDRDLVLRIVEKPPLPSTSSPGAGVGDGEVEKGEIWPPQANIHLPPPPTSLPVPTEEASKASEATEKGKKNAVYQVRSSQPPKSRFKDPGGVVGSNIYIVRLKAWNCSCAAFAYSAFPGGAVAGKWSWRVGEGDDVEMGTGRGRSNQEGEEEEWEFGGLSFDGDGDGRGSGVPVCKHLVACLLGERWGVLGGYVREKEVSREEMGGVCGEG